MKTNHFNEKFALQFDPFEGDFGTPGDRILKDKIVTARKSGECFLCKGKIVPGTRVRTRTDISEGEIMYFRWCSDCCAAMAVCEETGDCSAIEDRYC